ncbi:MAG: LamG domain-containing protein [Cytophagales bacterium]|nr:LamG domain-containing protein [Cytophagales bacterium]
MIEKTDNSGNPNVTFYQAFISNYTNVNNIVYRYAKSASISSQGTNIPFSKLPLNEWFHLVFSTDLTVTKTYLNGVLHQNFTQYSPIGTTTSPLVFGGNNTPVSTSLPFNGILDDIRIYSRALNSTEVTSLYNEGICYQSVSVTDTLKINVSITSYNPISYQNTIKVYPNPTNDQITIDYGTYTKLSGYMLKITNSLGNQVYLTQITQQQSVIGLGNWGGNGLYFVHLIDNSGNTVDIKKIVLQ